MKYNEATANRPEGSRLLDASQLYISIPEHIAKIKEEKAWEKNDRNAITVFKNGEVTITVMLLKGGATLLPQEVDALVTAQVVEGMISFESTQGKKNMTKGNIVVLHSSQPFNATAIEETILLLTVFHTESGVQTSLL
ncbi:hypothetical protein I5907_17835 [Panacibacter sp. DH6]|uniref:Uncharacterized protein n=1 Tax=Panacibacter microcysteis TaxID=2793269 RepID=A0A931GZA4_9BACT|nr:hypothetical protein [Panacibacter microcysteis]MBG9378103.1 hypothetical protein [Panacibacter microcysteis]